MEKTIPSLVDSLLETKASFMKFINFYRSNVPNALQISKDIALESKVIVKVYLIKMLIQVCEMLKCESEEDLRSYLFPSGENSDVIASNIHNHKEANDQHKLIHEIVKNKERKIFFIEKLRKANKKIKIKSERNSNFKGVSKNGKRWQVLLKNKRRYYLGSYTDEIEAAKVYDKYALIHFGLKAETNFVYNEEEKKKLIMEGSLFKD